MGLGANGSLLFCISGASTTVLMGLDGVVDGSRWCFSTKVGGLARGSHNEFGFVILVVGDYGGY